MPYLLQVKVPWRGEGVVFQCSKSRQVPQTRSYNWWLFQSQWNGWVDIKHTSIFWIIWIVWRSINIISHVCVSVEEQSELDERLAPEGSSNGATEDAGHAWTGVGHGVGPQDPLRRFNQRKKSDMVLLGCASILAAVGFGSDLLQLGRLQVKTTGNTSVFSDNIHSL